MLDMNELTSKRQKQLNQLKIVNNNTIKGCEAEIAKLHQFEKQGQYCHLFSLINITKPLLSNWRKLINTKNTAIVLANNISETVKVYDDVEGTLWRALDMPEYKYSSYDNFSVIRECICNNFSDFIFALLASKTFKNNKYTLHEQIFLLDACSGFGNVVLEDFKNDNLKLYHKYLLKKMFNAVYKRYSELDEEERTTLSDVFNETDYDQGSFECIANGFFDDNFANREFICYDKADLDALVHAYSIATNFKALIENTNHMHLGKYRKLVAQECQKLHHKPIYDVLSACND